MSAIPQGWRTRRERTDFSLVAHAFEACPDSLAVVENGTIVMANQAFATILGYQQGNDLQGHSLAEIVPGSRACTVHLPQPQPADAASCGYPT